MRKIEKTYNQFEEEKSLLYEAITDFQNGNKEKATIIYKMSKQYCYNIIYRKVLKFVEQGVLSGDTKTIVEDVMQELYMEFFKTVSQFRNEELNSFHKWIMVVANRMVLRYVDKNKMEILQKEQKQKYGEEYDVKTFLGTAGDEESNPEFVPDSALEKKDFQRLMKKFIKKLPEEQAETIMYHIYGGLKYHEIADIMGISLITVKTRMRKAKDSLKVMISDYEKKTGTQLRSVAPLPLIGFYLRVYTKHSKIPMSVDFKLFNQIRKAINQSASVFSRYIESFSAVNGMKEIVVGVVVTAVVGTGTAEMIRHNQPIPPTPNPTVDEQEEGTEEEKVQQEETKDEPIEHQIENYTYFIYWDSKTVDVSSYLHLKPYLP